MYNQPLHSLCATNHMTISLNSWDLGISYLEEHDEKTVEFPHSHPKEYEIHYVYDGCVEIRIDGSLITIPTGSLLFINQNVQHEILYTPHRKKAYLAVIFSIQQHSVPIRNNDTEEFENAHMKAFFDLIKGKDYIVCEDRYHNDRYIQTMLEESKVKEWGWFYRLQNLSATFVLNCIRNFVASPSLPASKAESNLPIAFTKYLHANYANPNLSLQDIADYFFISPRHVNRLFKEYFGASVSKTLTQYRINYTKNYLLDTDYSIDEIAEQVGFGSASTLSRLFKESEHMTISEYRYLCKQALQASRSLSDSQTPTQEAGRK
ncbi:MAG: AraC family transcriptional regulator [Lachnospiraceae bacterium]|nr:AraC family transcriptional regulator [Lachnospiraceae bacterium]